jgi:hypothetical protein
MSPLEDAALGLCSSWVRSWRAKRGVRSARVRTVSLAVYRMFDRSFFVINILFERKCGGGNFRIGP